MCAERMKSHDLRKLLSKWFGKMTIIIIIVIRIILRMLYVTYREGKQIWQNVNTGLNLGERRTGVQCTIFETLLDIPKFLNKSLIEQD